MREFAAIARISARLGAAGPSSGVALGVGDDAAAFDGGPWPIVCVDTLVEGVHWDARFSSPVDVGFKLLSCNLSDIAAMGGRPGPFLLALTLPAPFDPTFLDGLADGIDAARRAHALAADVVAPIGGDTTAAHGRTATLSLTLFGRPCHGQRLLRRDGGRADDRLWVSGPLGRAAAGLALLAAGRAPAWAEEVVEAHRRPRARLDLSAELAAGADVHAVIDVSDGLLGDLRHVLRASGCSAKLDLDAVPLSSATRRAADELGRDALAWALGGGEDFELLAAAAPTESTRLSGLGLVEVGRLLHRGEPGTVWVVGQTEPLTAMGYEHGGE